MVKPGPMQVNLPADLADVVRERMASGRFGSPEEVVRAALRLMAAEQAGDDAAAIRAKIEHGWRQAQSGQFVDGNEAARRWQGLEDYEAAQTRVVTWGDCPAR